MGSREALGLAKEGCVLNRSVRGGVAALLLGAGLAACNPTVKVEAPDKPIVINMNIKIEQEVRVKIEQQAQEDIAKNPDIF
ncbi:YnbE family lipoprotein [Hypericibacter adhaerens]|uniref:YnbE family lipoprotein n=1 Tax=Hypericibacter adhaerens TaxID=2602016 RepID=UPI0029818970|nr:YnbE family lipoprotein [Hypericibacter adhaerens]